MYRTISALSNVFWMVAVFCLKQDSSVRGIPVKYLGLMLLFVPAAITTLVLRLVKRECPSEHAENLQDLQLIDNHAVSDIWCCLIVPMLAPSWFVLTVLCAVMYAATFVTQYSDLPFMFFGYRRYSAVTAEGTHITLLARGSIIRNARDAEFHALRRLDSCTFVDV